MVLGDQLTFNYGNSKSHLFGLPITVFNKGAKYAAVVSIRGAIHKNDNKEQNSEVSWHSFFESRDIGAGEKFKPHWGFKSFPTTLIIDGHSAKKRKY